MELHQSVSFKFKTVSFLFHRTKAASSFSIVSVSLNARAHHDARALLVFNLRAYPIWNTGHACDLLDARKAFKSLGNGCLLNRREQIPIHEGHFAARNRLWLYEVLNSG